MPDSYILTPAAGGDPIHLTQSQLDRFFDNRDPGDWQVATAVVAGGDAPPVAAITRRIVTRHISAHHAIQGPE